MEVQHMGVEEKRRHPRIDSLNLVSFVCLDEENREVQQGMGRTLNVSESGILLETYAPIELQHIVSLQIGLEDDYVDIKGKAVHFSPCEGGKFESGIQFLETNEEEFLMLKKYIKAFDESTSEE